MVEQNWIKIVLLLSMVFVRYTKSSPCPQSQQTVKHVQSCPKSKEEWEFRAGEKRCSLLANQCKNGEESVYHCVLNSVADGTLEVCAPKARILGQACAEYNIRGAIVQESPYIKCNGSCPKLYTSTDAYLYQDCYEKMKRNNRNDPMKSCSQEESGNFASRPWQITSIVMITINVLLIILVLWLIRKVNLCQAKNKKKNGNDTESTLVKQRPGGSDHEELEPLTQTHGEERLEGMYIVAIDIGDIHLTMAVSTPQCPEDIKPFGSMERMCFLSDPKGEKFIFGEEALREYIKDRKKRDIHRKFVNFKFSDDSMVDEDYDEALKCVIERAKNKLKKKFRCVNQEDVGYVFIVPNYWKEEAVEKFNSKLSAQNKPQHNRFCVIRREQTLSPFIHEVKARAVCLNFNVDNLVLRPEPKSNTYAILHVGSTHFDLIFSGVEKDPIERRRTHVESKPWKSPPNDCFLNFFKNIIGPDIVKKWEEDYYWEYVSFFSNFEELVRKSDGYTNDTVTFDLELPKNLIEPGKEKKIEKDINDIKGIRFEKIKGTFQVHVELKLLMSFFDDVRNDVRTLVEDSWKSADSENVKCVVMTGAYSKRKIIWEIAEKDWFQTKKVTIVVPENTYEFAIGGAYFGQNKDWKTEVN